MNKGRVKFILLWIFLIISFLILAVILVFEAYGYRFNRQNWTLEPTGVIYIDGQPRHVDITVNGKTPRDTVLPVRFSKLLPGQYDIVLASPERQTWSKSFALSGGQAIEAKHIQLYLTAPKPAKSERKLTIEELQKDFKSQKGNLEIKNNEIWFNEKLMTRFGEKISGAILVNNRSNIIFQLGEEIRVMDIDGTNNVKLITLPVREDVAFALYADILVYAAGGEIFEAEIK